MLKDVFLHIVLNAPRHHNKRLPHKEHKDAAQHRKADNHSGVIQHLGENPGIHLLAFQCCHGRVDGIADSTGRIDGKIVGQENEYSTQNQVPFVSLKINPQAG